MKATLTRGLAPFQPISRPRELEVLEVQPMPDAPALPVSPPSTALAAALSAEALQVARYLEAGSAASTRRAYDRSQGAWAAFCAARGVEPMPAPPEALIVYLSERAAAGLAPRTLARDLAGIVAAHRAAGLASPREHPGVRAVLRGIRRTHGMAPHQKQPLLVEDLGAALPRGTSPRAVRDRALLLLGFAAALRRSELVGLDVADLAPCAEGLIVTLRRSKTDPEAEGVLVGVPRARRARLCAVRALDAWRALLAAAERDVGPLFRPVNRHGGIGTGRLSTNAVAELVKEAAARAGLDPDAFGGHSLRAGFATSAVAAGLAEHDIMRQTRHRSVQSFRGYVRKGSLFLDNPAGRLL